MTQDKFRKHCIVVGGGTSGWLSACYLKAALADQIDITIIDPDKDENIGVGESTLPTIHKTLRTLDIPLQTFLRETNGTIKQGITFKQWLKNGSNFYHPYDITKHIGIKNLFDAWYASGRKNSFSDFASLQPTAIRENKSPFRLEKNSALIACFNHSLHVDSKEITRFLKEHSRKLKINHLPHKVAKVTRKQDGVESLTLDNGIEIRGDIYIDCSGFKRILSDRNSQYQHFKFLPCDTAIATSVKHEQADISPTTTATAHDSGWLWDIPLYTRRGVGCVFSQAHMSLDQAHQTLTKHFGGSIDDNSLKIIPFRAGNLTQPWEGNVINIGLSAGFIEPLESTGIYFIEEALHLLESIFPLKHQTWAQNKFNKEMTERYQECADFVYLHYLLSDRDDSQFWREFKDPANIPDHIKDILDFWEGTPPSNSHFTNGRQIFGLPAHEYILYGMNFLPKTYIESNNISPESKQSNSFSQNPINSLQSIDLLLDHKSFLDVAFGKIQPKDALLNHF